MKSFDTFYSKSKSYFGENPSLSLEVFLNNYRVKSGNAIDIGAGEGRNSFFLAKKGFQVVAVEPSLVGANQIKNGSLDHQLDIEICPTDYLSSGPYEKQFDLVVAVTSLDHMDYESVLKSVAMIKESLKESGYVFIIVFTEEDPGNQPIKVDASECAGFIQHYFRKGELKELFSDFKIHEYFEYSSYDTSHGSPHYHHKAKLIAQKIK